MCVDFDLPFSVFSARAPLVVCPLHVSVYCHCLDACLCCFLLVSDSPFASPSRSFEPTRCTGGGGGSYGDGRLLQKDTLTSTSRCAPSECDERREEWPEWCDECEECDDCDERCEECPE